MGRIFGTDGARGIANKELTVDLALSIGRAAAVVLTNEDVKHPTFLIGKDTRVSGDMLEGALVAGLTSVGANVIILGVVPTPAVAYEDLDLICASRLLAVFQPPYRDLHPYHFCLGCLRRGICRDPVILCVYLVPAFLCSKTVILVHS